MDARPVFKSDSKFVSEPNSVFFVFDPNLVFFVSFFLASLAIYREREREIELWHSGKIQDRILPIQIQPYDIRMQDPFHWSWSTLFQVTRIKVLNIGYRDRIGWRFFISDIGDMRTYRAFKSDTIYNEILITKSWFSVIDIIYLIKMM